MLRIRRKTLLIWSVILLSALVLISSVYKDTYLIVYWSILFLFASWCIFCIRERIVNTLLIFSVFYTVLLAFGPMILYIEGFSYYKTVGNYIIISYLCFAIGYHYGGRKIKHKSYKIFLPTNKPKSVFIVSLMVFCVAISAYSLYFVRNWSAIFITDLEKGRVAAMAGNGLLLWLGSLIWLSVYMLYEQSLINGKYKMSTCLIFAISVAFSILLGFRSALVNPILVMFFMRNKKKEISIVKMIALAMALFVFVGVYGAIRGGVGSSFDSLLHEFKVSSVNLNNILETFPKRIEFQLGSTYLLDFRSLIDDEVSGTTMWLKNALKLSFSGGGVTPTLIGEFYINWGILGILIGMTFSGLFFKRIDRIYRNPNNSIFLSCLILGYIRPIIRGGIANSTVTLLVYIIGYCGCQFVAKKMKA